MRISAIFAAILFCFVGTTASQGQDLTSVVCNNTAVGWAECAAVCPAGQNVLHCSYTLGNYAGEDNCPSVDRFQLGPTAANGQAYPQPHDRCLAAIQCSDSSKSLSVQVFATCYQP